MIDSEEIIVSVAMITYGHEKYIRQAIDSVLMQETEYKYEIIIGEDKSPDNTREILLEYQKKYPDKIMLLLRDENIGGTKNLYDVLMNCNGKYIIILEGDDYWLNKNKIQILVDKINNCSSDIIGVSHVREQRKNDGTLLGHDPSPKIIGKRISVDTFLKGIYFSATATLFRNIFKDSDEKYSILYRASRNVGDFTICMLLLHEGDIFVLNEILGVYRVVNSPNATNYNSATNAIEKFEDHILLINAVKQYFNNKYNFNNEYINKTYRFFVHCIKSKNIKVFTIKISLIGYINIIVFLFNLPFVYISSKINNLLKLLNKKVKVNAL